MAAAGFIVPPTFEDLPDTISKLYQSLVQKGTIVPQVERDPPVIPMDYKWATELGMFSNVSFLVISSNPMHLLLGLIRKPAAFISTISDERGQELLYAGMRISDVFKEDIGLGGVVSLLWFKYVPLEYLSYQIFMACIFRQTSSAHICHKVH